MKIGFTVRFLLAFALAATSAGCRRQAKAPPTETPKERPADTHETPRPALQTRPSGAAHSEPGNPPGVAVVHVFVCLADNKHQGIVRVPPALGNGQDPTGNLYWGAMYGVKTFFGRSSHWSRARVLTQPGKRAVLERVAFESKANNSTATFVIADAYDGAHMTTALRDFFDAAAGKDAESIDVQARAGRVRLFARGGADLVCFVGHNGLMDGALKDFPAHTVGRNPQAAVVLACKSHAYFGQPLAKAACPFLIGTTGLMAPEAYTLDAIIRSWSAGDDPQAVRRNAAKAYARYQKCGLPAAMRLFVAGR